VLPGLVDGVLRDAGMRVDQVDAVAVSSGPGSFTGLRIGFGFAKGLVYAIGARLVLVPTLEALATVVGARGGPVCAALDARKQEVYAAIFEPPSGPASGPEGTGGLRRTTDDLALSAAALAARLPEGCTLIGDAGEPYADILGKRATLLPFTRWHPVGSVVARLGWERLLAGGGAEPGTAEPSYVREPEARLPSR
jgi:tRNA threonylcarbamoyladenosine biosynthesis protein TsaB